MPNHLDIIVFDFETGGTRHGYHEPIQVAGKAYNARTLEPYPIENGGEFMTMMKPMHFDRLESEALRINGKTVAELEKAPDQGVAWNAFVKWVERYNRGKTKGAYTAPIAAGKNIRDFDFGFLEDMNLLHCKKKEKTVIFNRIKLDLEDDLFRWFENTDELKNQKLDTVREYFAMDTEGAHDALVDVRQTGDLIMFFLKLNRYVRRLAKDGQPWMNLPARFQEMQRNKLGKA